MSKQTSLVTFKGRMGGISFYERKGVPAARKAYGPDRNRILTDRFLYAWLRRLEGRLRVRKQPLLA